MPWEILRNPIGSTRIMTRAFLGPRTCCAAPRPLALPAGSGRTGDQRPVWRHGHGHGSDAQSIMVNVGYPDILIFVFFPAKKRVSLSWLDVATCRN